MTMDHTTLEVALVVFNVVVTLIGALVAWFVRSLMSRVDKLEEQNLRQLESISALRTDMPTHYVRRDDFSKLADDIFAGMRRIEDKLDRKADRS